MLTGILPWALLAYFIGSFPTAWLVGRAFGVDLREEGSGNLGGTNAYRVLGARGGLPVILVDISKGYLPAAFFPRWDGSGVGELALVYGLLAILGHVWPIWLRFRGGKGVATGAGVLIALAPFAALVATLVWIGIVAVTRTVSIASLSAAAVVPLVAAITDAPLSTTLFCTGVALFVWWTHRSNLARIARGEELQFGSGGSDPEEENGS
ncbi:MAG: glycerol-3-phosphate 1-O-acyltransferase PlsY [Gemmatimonadota bacterium]